MDIDLSQLLANLGLALTAAAFALPIALEREQADRPAGLRTFPVVALASCAYIVLGMRAFPDSAPAQARIVQGLLTGMGFIGGGAILKWSNEDGGHVVGIATAASLWNTGAIGVAVAYGRFEVAAVLSLVNFLILRFIKPTERGELQERGRVREADDT